MSPGPDRRVVVLGTGTEVGKTWVAARLLTTLRSRGLAVSARKPAQSAAPGDTSPSDADILASASGEASEVVCPPHRRYPLAMAPPMAAEAMGEPAPTIAELASELTWPPEVDIGLVETAGGVLSPAAADGTSLDLARATQCDLGVLVADAGLGTLNAVRHGWAAVRDESWPTVVVLNRYVDDDPLHRANRRWLVDRDAIDVVVDVDGLADRLC